MNRYKLYNTIKHLLSLGIVLAGLALMLFYIKYSFVDGASEKSKGYYINDVYDSPSREFSDGVSIEQEFSAATDIYGMTVRFHNSAQPQKGSAHIVLLDKENQTVLAEGNVNTETLINDGYSALIFEQPYKNTDGQEKEFIFKITPYFENENAFMRIWEDVETETIGFGVINHRPDAAKVNRFFLYLCIITIFAVIAIYLLCFVIKPKREILFAVSYLLVSLLFTFVLPPYSSPDEEAHFNSAYKLANKFEGYTARQQIDETIYTRVEDHNSVIEDKYTTVVTYEYITENLFKASGDNSIVSDSNNWVVYDFDGVYTMGALGILTGKLLNLGYLPMMYLGRLFNLLLFTICLYFAIKITPTGKEVFMVLSFLPITMHITNSFSRDTFVISLGFLFVAYLLKLIHQEENYKLWQLALLAVICILLAPSKFIYSVMCVLVLLLHKEKLGFKSNIKLNKKQFVLMGVGFGALVLILGIVMYKTNGWVFNYVLSSFQVPVPLEELMLTNPLSTFNIGLILSYPVVFIKLVLNTIYTNGAYYIKSIAGGVLGYNSVIISDAFIFIILVLVLISICSTPNDRYELRTKDRLSFIAVFCLVAALVVYVAVTWTPVIDKTIYGIQGKYLIPAMPLLLIASKNKVFIVKNDIFNGLCFAAALTSICVSWNAFVVIMQR